MFKSYEDSISPTLERYQDFQQLAQMGSGQGAPSGQPPMQAPNPSFEQQVQEPIENSRMSPIRIGAEDAMKAARNSVHMNDEQHKRAMGRAIMALFSNMGTPSVGSGLAGNLGMLNRGLMPALNSYDAERAYQEQQNFLLQKFQQEKENELARQLQHQAALEEQHRHHLAAEELQGIHRNLAQQKYQEEAEKKASEKMIEKEFQERTGMRGKLMDNYSPSQAIYAQKKYEKYIEKSDAAHAAKEDARRIHAMAIDKNTKHLFNSQYFSILDRYGHDQGMLNSALTKLVPKKDREALFLLNAARKNLYVNSLKGISSKALNMQLEGQLYSPIPGAQMTPRAASVLTKKIMQQSDYDVDVYNSAANAHENGFDVTIGPKSYELAKRGKLGLTQKSENSDQDVGIIETRGPDGRIKKFEGKITPENVLELEKRGYKLLMPEPEMAEATRSTGIRLRGPDGRVIEPRGDVTPEKINALLKSGKFELVNDE